MSATASTLSRPQVAGGRRTVGHPAAAPPPPPLRCLVVDHETASTIRLVRLLGADPLVARVSAARSATDALRVLLDTPVDVAFVEAAMPGMDGIELASLLRRLPSAPAIVFVTRDPGRAAEAFDLCAVDYLSKPPSAQRLAESVRRVAAARRAYNHTRTDPVPATADPRPGAVAGVDVSAETIPVTIGATTKLIPRSAVRWIQARGDYARLYTANGSYLVRAAMTALAESLRPLGMVRIHRSYLVALRHIAEVRVSDSGAIAVVVDGHQLPVSRRAAPRLRDLLVRAGAAPLRDPASVAA